MPMHHTTALITSTACAVCVLHGLGVYGHNVSAMNVHVIKHLFVYKLWGFCKVINIFI